MRARWASIGRASLRRASVPALLAACVLVPFAPILWGRTIAWGDTARFYGPVRPWVGEALRGGRLPLWIPSEGTGHPLFAEGMHGVLHPVSVLAAFAFPSDRIDPVVLGYLVLAAWGAYALARTLGATAGPAALGAVSFALSGYVLSASDNLVFLAGCASLAWMVAAARRAGEGGRWGVGAVAVATAAAVLAGDAQAVAVGIAASVLLAADAGGVRGAARAASGVAVGLLLGGVQLVPEWIHLGRTARADYAAFVDQGRWAFSPWRVVEWVSPGFFARFDVPGAAVYRAFAGSGERTLPFAHSVFVGAPVLALAAAGSRRRAGRGVAVLALAALWLALGHHAGATRLLGDVPIWGRFRYSEKLIGPFTLFVSALAALGAERIRCGEHSRALRRAVAVAAAAAVVVVLTLAVAPQAWETAMGAVAARAGAPPGEETRAALQVARARLTEGLAVCAGGLLALVAAIALRVRRGARAWEVAAIGLVVLESAYALPFATHMRAHLDPGPALRAVARADRIPRIVTPIEPDVIVGEADPFSDTLRLNVQVGCPAYSLLAGVESIEAYTGLPPRRLHRLSQAFGDSFWRLARRYAATHAVLPPDDDGNLEPVAVAATVNAKVVAADPSTGITAWALPHREWASFAPSAEVVGTPEDAIEGIMRLSRAGNRGAVVEAAGESFSTAAGRVVGFERRPETIRIEAVADGEAFLVVNDAYWEGWTARIDGRPVAIHAVDALVRGVRWPPGRHLLAMEYRPPEVRAGLAVSGAAAIALGALGWIRRRRGRERERDLSEQHDRDLPRRPGDEHRPE